MINRQNITSNRNKISCKTHTHLILILYRPAYVNDWALTFTQFNIIRLAGTFSFVNTSLQNRSANIKENVIKTIKEISSSNQKYFLKHHILLMDKIIRNAYFIESGKNEGTLEQNNFNAIKIAFPFTLNNNLSMAILCLHINNVS